MNQILTFEDRLVQFLHATFPDAREMPAGELKDAVGRLHRKATGYGFAYEAEIAIYVTTAYLLGENFDTEFPAAADILTHPGYPSDQKADILESWTKQLFQALGEQPESAPDQILPAGDEATRTHPGDYLAMEADSQPYHEMADWLVQQLTGGNAGAVIGNFSPNFISQLGLPTVIQVFEEQMLPFFAGQVLGGGRTVTFTHDSFGSSGFAFYLTVMGSGGEKPFVLYVVNENGRLVMANLVLNKTFADMH